VGNVFLLPTFLEKQNGGQETCSPTEADVLETSEVFREMIYEPVTVFN
jgi:hypothetical protein